MNVLMQKLYKALLLIAIAVLLPASLKAQDMVTSVENHGLERTVSYNVASFTDIRDKKLEDVMSKMPGISKIEMGDGSYSYNGLVIDRMYINGKDVLEGNYTAIYNMKPEDVERLEITENHVYMKVMRGKQFSNSASINVVLKKEETNQWFGSVKGGLGLSPLLVNTDLIAMKMGNKWQTTLLFQTDNTGLTLGNAVRGFGGVGMDDGAWDSDPYSLSGINYKVKSFLDLEPELAPLSLDRVRFNRSGVFNLGTTVQLKNDYQLNFQLLFHSDRLTAYNGTETTYYMDGGQTIDYVSTERSKNHQNDIQADLVLLSNTDKYFLRNNLSFATQWYDTHTVVTGSAPNTMNGTNKPLLLKNSFQYKLPLGENVLTIGANAGLYSRPQNLSVSNEREGTIRQEISSYSAYAEAKAMLDRRISNHLTFSLYAGLSGNLRQLKADMLELVDHELQDVKSRFNAYNIYSGASLTYISDRLQASVSLPIDYSHFALKDLMNQSKRHASKYYFSPELTLTYIPFQFLSLNLEAALYDNEHPRMDIYKGMVFSDFRTLNEGYAGFRGSKSTYAQLTASFSWPKSSFFVNANLGYWGTKEYWGEVMDLDTQYMVNKYTEDPGEEKSFDASIDISKGIETFKGMVGIKVAASLFDSDVERNGVTLPFKSRVFNVSPYINGRLNAWWNMIYKLQYSRHSTEMDDSSTYFVFHDYNHSLEMIFSPWSKFNFSVLGEHYHTEFSNNLTKDLVLFDCKAEYNLTNNLQLILSAKNILNQKIYKLTVEDTDLFAKSYSSYDIRPRNVLLSLYYKF